MKFEFIYIFSLVLDFIVNLYKKLLGTNLIWVCTDLCWFDSTDAANDICHWKLNLVEREKFHPFFPNTQY